MTVVTTGNFELGFPAAGLATHVSNHLQIRREAEVNYAQTELPKVYAASPFWSLTTLLNIDITQTTFLTGLATGYSTCDAVGYRIAVPGDDAGNHALTYLGEIYMELN